MKTQVLFLFITALLMGCAPAPSPAPATAGVDVNAISTQTVATVYTELTQAPPTATPQPALLVHALKAAHLTELAWSPDGQKIIAAACQETCQLNLYSLDLSPVWSVDVAGIVSYLEYSPDGKLIAALVKNGIQSRDENGKIQKADQTEIWLFNSQDGAFLRKWDAEQAVMLHFNPAGPQLATAGGEVILWEIASGQVRWRLKPWTSSEVEKFHGPGCLLETLDSVNINSDGTLLVYSGQGRGSSEKVSSASDLRKCYSMLRWDLSNNAGQIMYGNFMAFGSEKTPAPQKLALQIVSVSSFPGFIISSLLVMNSGFYPYNLHFSSIVPDSQKSVDPQEKPAETWGLDFVSLTVTGAAISPSAERVAVWGQTPANPPAYFLNLVDARMAQPIAEVRLEADPALATFSAAFSPDGRRLASIDRGGALYLWQVKRTLP